MRELKFVGPLIRFLRLKKDWSQETLCKGICAVSYLSKIEQGRVEPNATLLVDLFERLGAVWMEDPEDYILRDRLYEGIFSWDRIYTKEWCKQLTDRYSPERIGPCYLDFNVILAYCTNDRDRVPEEMIPVLDDRQRCLYAIMYGQHELAHSSFPCSLTAFCVAEEAYNKGNYTYALEYLQTAFDQASREGYVYLMMTCQSYMANCYADIGNMEAMERHSRIASRLGRALGDEDLVNTVAYNLAATELEFGNYQKAYEYFSKLEEHSVLSLHKLAICCEALDMPQQALDALEKAEQFADADALDRRMCSLVRYRLEHGAYLRSDVYGQLLMDTFYQLRKDRHYGFARFHLPWVTQWLTANRKYREAYEVLKDFTKKGI